MSFLNNDVECTPLPRREDVSSISLSGQFASAVPSFPSLTHMSHDLEALPPRTIPIPPTMQLPLTPAKLSKTIMDHPRVASYAFAFDIDGVLVRGPETLPWGVEAVKYLDGENPYNIKVPYIFVTNGGGKHESVRAEDLSKRLQTQVEVEQVVQGHTPMRLLADQYKTVLVIGGVGNTCRDIAKEYGFDHAYTPMDIMKWDPSVSPYYEMSEEDHQHCHSDNADFSQVKFDAILVFADSRNWAVDQQIILELLMSKGGVMGTLSQTFEDGPPIYFAHSDFVWSTNYRLVRYGMGALQVSIAALFKEHTGKELKVIRFGKPQRSTFHFAEKVLKDWRKNVLEGHIDELTSTAGDSTDIFSNGADYHYKDVFNDSETEDADQEEDDDDDNDDGSEALTFQSLTKLKTLPAVSAHSARARSKSLGTTNTTNTARSFSCPEDLPPPSTVYFVGDTPESDIRFANSHDESWFSILVNTGVHQRGAEPKYKPKVQCENVLEAVKFAVEREHAKELAEWNKDAVKLD